jgi:2-oxoglutarate dehydrogenase E1 component
MTTRLQKLYQSTPLQGANAAFIEALYEDYLEAPERVPAVWRRYFDSLGGDFGDVAHGPIVASIGKRLSQPRRANGASAAELAPAARSSEEKQAAVSRLIQVYSLRGHQIADIDPLGVLERHVPAVLKLDFLGLGEDDFDTEFFTGGLAGTGHARMKLRDILALLRRIYCGKVAAEFAHISRARERLWLRENFEGWMTQGSFAAEEQRAILGGLTRAEGIERYLNTKYVGQKRFSLEGAETLIPMLDDLIQSAGRSSIQEIAIGMAHRGRRRRNCFPNSRATTIWLRSGVRAMSNIIWGSRPTSARREAPSM